MGRYEDELAVRSLAAAYSDAVNRRDGPGMAAVYADDGELHLAPPARPLVGKDFLTKAFTRLVEKDREYLFQMTHSGVVEVDGDKATGRWWFSEVKKPTGQPMEMVMGVYQDEAIRTADGWRFSKRTVSGMMRWELPEGADISFTARDAMPAFLPLTGLPRP